MDCLLYLFKKNYCENTYNNQLASNVQNNINLFNVNENLTPNISKGKILKIDAKHLEKPVIKNRSKSKYIILNINDSYIETGLFKNLQLEKLRSENNRCTLTKFKNLQLEKLRSENDRCTLTQFNQIKCNSAYIKHIFLTNCKFNQIKCNSAYIKHIFLTNCKCTYLSFKDIEITSDAELLSQDYKNNFNNITFEDSTINNCNIANLKISDSKFLDCVLKNNTIKYSLHEKSSWEGCTLQSYDAYDTSWNTCEFRQSQIINNSNFTNCRFKNVDFKNCSFYDIKILDSTLNNVTVTDLNENKDSTLNNVTVIDLNENKDSTNQKPQLQYLKITNTKLINFTLTNLKIKNFIFDNNTIINNLETNKLKISNGTVTNTSIINAKLNDVKMKNIIFIESNIVNPIFNNVNLENVDLRDLNFEFTNYMELGEISKKSFSKLTIKKVIVTKEQAQLFSHEHQKDLIIKTKKPKNYFNTESTKLFFKKRFINVASQFETEANTQISTKLIDLIK